MTVCNMSIEAGARAGMIAPDDTTYEYMAGKRFAPKGEAFDAAVEGWKQLPTDEEATYDRTLQLDAADIAPQVTWGTNPGMVTDVTGRVPDPVDMATADEKTATEHALAYMDLKPGTPITDIPVDRVFIGSCTNSRISDLRAAAEVAKGRKVADTVNAMVVPRFTGSQTSSGSGRT